MATTTKRAARLATGPVDPDLVPKDSGVEVWRNASAGKVYINRIGEYGRKFSEVISAGRAFQITPTERRLNQSACAQADLDMFTNGTLEPVNLLDDEPDTERLRTNPNLITDRDMRALFRLKGEVFRQRIEQITNTAAIHRLLEAARDERYNASLAQFEALKLRKITLDGSTDRQPAETREVDAGVGRPVTPT
ncbi:hypothetical protein [Caudovirales GX15bay]|nr:hypothetical protein [Caudovirales GX15bay]